MNPSRLRRLRRLPAIIGLGLVTSAILLAQSPAVAAPETTAIIRAEIVPGLRVAVAPGLGGVLVPGTDLPVTVSLTNAGSAAVAAGTVRITLKGQTLSTRSALSTFLANTDERVSTRGDMAVEVARGELSPGESEVVTGVLPVAAANLGKWGVRGVDASVYVGDTLAAEGRNSILWSGGTAPGVARVAIAVPITPGAQELSLIPAQMLDTLTASTGLLTRQLDAVQNRPVAILIDPRIIASVRVLGSAAPHAAVAWLERLAAVSNPIYPLSYADSDLSAQSQVGTGQVLSPISLTYGLTAANFTNATPTPAATRAQDASGLPDTAALTAWNYTSTSIAWPRRDTVVTQSLPAFAAAGLTQSIVSSSNLALDAESGAGYAGVASSGADTVLVSEPLVSAAFGSAASAGTAVQRAASIAQLAGSLAVIAQERPASGAIVLATLDRQWANTAGGLAEAIDSLAGLGFAAASSFPQFTAQAPNPGAVIVDAPEHADRINQIASLYAEEAALTAFSSALISPETLTAPTRTNLLALLDNSWVTDTPGWTKALAKSAAAATKTMQDVSIVPGSQINLFSNSANMPVLVQNGLASPVTVTLRVIPSNGRLIVDNEVTVTIPANSNKQALVPVRAGVANGEVMVRVELVSPTGILISSVPTFIPVTVNADWEVAGSWLVGSLVMALLIFAAVRIVLRRRHETARTEPSDADV